ncbi:hypothetical protein EVAR_9995_1 [Eumeta japonica]|uniref:Uncharacterized protein n=1 Tax=Eumeta variegata TaxID=151549 RepID=A0A4C1TR70_EUMVA|nr:hypothetical protein EVAR_9995_1 [Eumeta japonica]
MRYSKPTHRPHGFRRSHDGISPILRSFRDVVARNFNSRGNIMRTALTPQQRSAYRTTRELSIELRAYRYSDHDPELFVARDFRGELEVHVVRFEPITTLRGVVCDVQVEQSSARRPPPAALKREAPAATAPPLIITASTRCSGHLKTQSSAKTDGLCYKLCYRATAIAFSMRCDGHRWRWRATPFRLPPLHNAHPRGASSLVARGRFFVVP